MSRITDWIIGTFAAIGLLVLLGWQSERDQRIAAEDAARQISTAADTACPPREGQRVVATIATDGQQWARWCGYYRTVIESVRISWERQ